MIEVIHKIRNLLGISLLIAYNTGRFFVISADVVFQKIGFGHCWPAVESAFTLQNRSCVDMSNAKIYENVEIAENKITFLEIESMNNELLKYANERITHFD